MADAPQQHFLEDLSVGMSSSLSKIISAKDVEIFADVSGDHNPVHLDEDFAARETPFGGRIAHGMLTASLLSAMFGTQFPGLGCIYLSQTLKFKAPVMLDSEVTATVTVADINVERARVTFDCVCTVPDKTGGDKTGGDKTGGDKVVLDGQAVLLVPKRG